jgi:hypothetical protein
MVLYWVGVTGSLNQDTLFPIHRHSTVLGVHWCYGTWTTSVAVSVAFVSTRTACPTHLNVFNATTLTKEKSRIYEPLRCGVLLIFLFFHPSLLLLDWETRGSHSPRGARRPAPPSNASDLRGRGSVNLLVICSLFNDAVSSSDYN